MTTADPKADAVFMAFNACNPHVLDLFIRFAREAKAAGRKRIGAKMIAERIRWETTVATLDADYKINNNHVSRLARLAMQREPDLAGMFKTRALKRAPGELPLLT